MSFFKQRFARTDLSGHPSHPVPGDDPGDGPRDPASPSSADIRQPPEPSVSELTPPAALSRGREPAAPSGSSGTNPCTCLHAFTGNGVAELLRPRFARLEADPARLFLLRGITTLRRAKFDLGVVSFKESISGGWVCPSRKTRIWVDTWRPLNN